MSDIEKEIQMKGINATHITPADIEAAIAEEHYISGSDIMGCASVASAPSHPLHRLTLCVLVLRNGFVVTGVSPENFDAEIGRKIARQNAVKKIWPLMDYALRDKLHAHSQSGTGGEG